MKLEKQLKKELQARFLQTKKIVNSFEDVNQIKNHWYYRKFLTKKQLENIENFKLRELKKLILEKELQNQEKTYQKELKKINAILSQDSVRWGKCSIDWINNRTWGNCPRGEYCNGFKYQEYRSVTGCGYCKLSTLTANMLNDDINLMSYIYKFVEKNHINKDNIQNKLGYGIRIYNGQPYFEGGVGLECHKRILERLGFKVEHYETRKSDILTFDLK